MQVWAPEFEVATASCLLAQHSTAQHSTVAPVRQELLARDDVFLPRAEMDVHLEEFCRFVLGICDVPIHDNIIESLHLLFTLYCAFKDSQHFQAAEPDPP